MRVTLFLIRTSSDLSLELINTSISNSSSVILTIYRISIYIHCKNSIFCHFTILNRAIGLLFFGVINYTGGISSTSIDFGLSIGDKNFSVININFTSEEILIILSLLFIIKLIIFLLTDTLTEHIFSFIGELLPEGASGNTIAISINASRNSYRTRSAINSRSINVNNTSLTSRNCITIAVICPQLFTEVEDYRYTRLSAIFILAIGCTSRNDVKSIVFKNLSTLINNILKKNINSSIDLNGLH